MNAIRIATAAAAMLCSVPSFAQSPESDPTPGVEALPPPPDGYLVPDVPTAVLEEAEYEDHLITLKLGVAFLYDYTWIEQDSASIAQVGVQDDAGEVRDARLTFRGDLKFLGNGGRYQITAQYKGFDQDPTATDDWAFTDAWIAHDFSFATLTVGKTKQTYAYELVGDSANLPQAERLLNPFFVSRDIGLKLSNKFFNERATWAVGYFQEKGPQATARVTAVPVWGPDRYLHFGVAIRYNGAEDDELRYSGRPESNVTDLYVDTGNIPADHAWHTGFEALWAHGPYTILGEVVRADLDAPTVRDPTFTGWYVTASWTFSGGGPRPYDRNVGYARRMPVGVRHGEFELVGRIGRVDLDDNGVSGGTLDKWYLGVNWWATKRWKASLGYGDADLERFGLDGDTQLLLARLQWIY